MNCPLCYSNSTTSTPLPAERRGWCCAECGLIALDPAQQLTLETERERYLLHRNARHDIEYVAFLERLVAPLVAVVTPPADVLDFGSGPAPVMAELLHARGYRVTLYDPLFANDEAALVRQYHAIACCETAEHFRQPATEWQRMCAGLMPGGVLAVMTLLYEDADLSNWWYARDPTHVCFYALRTVEWLACKNDFEILQCDGRVIILRKK